MKTEKELRDKLLKLKIEQRDLYVNGLRNSVEAEKVLVQVKLLEWVLDIKYLKIN